MWFGSVYVAVNLRSVRAYFSTKREDTTTSLKKEIQMHQNSKLFNFRLHNNVAYKFQRLYMELIRIK